MSDFEKILILEGRIQAYCEAERYLEMQGADPEFIKYFHDLRLMSLHSFNYLTVDKKLEAEA